MAKKNWCILVIPDLHMPYHHPCSIKFLDAVKKKYHPDRIVNLGDEVDNHAVSFHDSDVDLFSAGHELEKAKEYLQELVGLFPKMDLLESNHGSLYFRRVKNAGLPITILKSLNEILEVPKTWSWHSELIVTCSNGTKVYFTHGKSSAPLKLSQGVSMSCAQGHFHNLFSVNWWRTGLGEMMFDMKVGCLIDQESLAFAYGRNIVHKPMLGCAIIENGIPKLIPMITDGRNKWIGKL